MKGFLMILLAGLLVLSCENGTNPPGGTGSEWYPVLQDAIDAARGEDKLVLMLAGRDACGNCTYMKETVCEGERVAAVIEADYVTAYIDVDSSTDWHAYASGLGSFTLPLIALIDPDDPSSYLSRTTGVVYEGDFINDLQAPL